MSNKTIFEKMWDGDVFSNEIFRSEEHGLFATLDNHPATKGHVLVIPKEPIDDWTDLSDERLFQTAILGRIVAQRIMTQLEPLRVIRLTSGFGVPHFHDHLVPSYVRGDAATVFDPERVKNPTDPTELAAVQEILTFPPELSAFANEELTRVKEAPHL